MTTIYAVASGEYSGYRIEAVFDSKARAQAYIDYQGAHLKFPRDYEIEEWELNAFCDPIARGLTCFYVAFPDATKAEGTTDDYGAQSVDDYFDKPLPNERVYPYVTSVWARDEQDALKIANEQRVAYVHRLERTDTNWVVYATDPQGVQHVFRSRDEWLAFVNGPEMTPKKMFGVDESDEDTGETK